MNNKKTTSVLVIGLGMLGLVMILSNMGNNLQQQVYAIETITAHLSEVDDNEFMKDSTIYTEISDLTTNSSLYTDIEVGEGRIYNTISDDRMGISFPAKVPDPDNPNKQFVIDVDAYLNVKSIETDPTTGLKTYYAEPEFSTLVSGDVAMDSAELTQTDDDEAILTITMMDL